MKNVIALVALAVGLCGCAELKVPVTGVLGSEPAQGAAVGNINGEGSFYVVTARGLRCDGSYDPLSTEPTLQSAIACNDGRTGNLIITRQMDMLSGTAIGRLSDGTEGQFVFGNITFDQAFGGGSVRTNTQ